MTTTHQDLLPEHRVLASGRVAILGDRGRVTEIMDADEFAQLDAYLHTCECEIDYSCHLHAGRATWLETRYDASFDRDEEGF